MRALPLLLLFGCGPSPDVTTAPEALPATALARCADDRFEPNDTPSEAAEWGEGPLVVTSTSDDYWSFEIGPGIRFEILSEFRHQEGWGGLELYDANGALLNAGVDEPYGIRLVWINTSDLSEQVFVRSTLYEGECDTYSLTWMSYPVQCPVDLIEDNDTFEDAVPFDDGQLDLVELDDPDWWSIEQPPHSVTAVEIEQPWSFADLRLDLFDHDGLDLQNGGTRGHLVNNTDGILTGRGKVSIENFTNRGVCAPYLLHRRTVTLECSEEPIENDLITDTRTVPVGRLEAEVERFDDDWFRVEVPPDYRLWIEGEVEPLLGSTWVWLYDEEASYFAATASPPYALHAENRTDDTAVWHIQVQAADQPLGCVPYALNMGLVFCDHEDVLEPNNTIEQALALPDASTTLTIKESDPDVWFVGDVPPGWSLDVSVTFKESLGRVESQLVLADGTPIEDGSGEWGEEVMAFTNPTEEDIPVYLTTRLPPVFQDCAQRYEVSYSLRF